MALNLESLLARLVVTDGDLRGELLSRGWTETAFPERANLSRPDIVQDAMEAFLDAGAEAVVTNTTLAHAAALAWRGIECTPDELDRINRQGAAIARSAARLAGRPDTPVFGAIGPPGGLVSFGEIDADTLQAGYNRQVASLAAGGVDALLCHGFTEAESLVIALQAAAASGLPVVASLIFDSGPERTETAMGIAVPQACTIAAEAGASIIGCEPGESPDSAAAIVTMIRQSCSLPVWLRISPGFPELRDGKIVYVETPVDFAGRLARLAEAGICLVGGDRGATPDHIAALIAARGRLRPAR
jgi:5-methyltetrahydrofolate--homocysteine methyltransferase